MQNLEISDYADNRLHAMAGQEQISSSDSTDKKHSEELAKNKELKSIFKPYQKDLTRFRFDREEANAR